MKHGKISIPESVQLSEEQRHLKDSLVSLFKQTRSSLHIAEERETSDLKSISDIMEKSFAQLDVEFDKQAAGAGDQRVYNQEYTRYDDHHRRLSAAEATAIQEARDKCRDSVTAALGHLNTQCRAAASDETASFLPMNVTTARFFRDLYSESRDMILDKKIPDTLNNE